MRHFLRHILLCVAVVLMAAGPVAAQNTKAQENRKAALEKEIAEIQKAKAGSFADDAVKSAKEFGSVKAVVASCDAADASAMRDTADKIRDKLECGVVFLAAEGDGKLLFTAMATKSAVDCGIHCGNIIKEAAKVAGGGGGGRPDMAQAGGKDVSKLADALAKAEEMIASQVK